MTQLKTLSVSAIKSGTVIDHIPSGQALKIIQFLPITAHKKTVTLGLHLISKSMGVKDLIKVESYQLSEEEIKQIAIFAPKSTVNIIENFNVFQKITPMLPSFIKAVLMCPNANCVSYLPSVESFFHVGVSGKKIKLNCHYCEQTFDRDNLGTLIK